MSKNINLVLLGLGGVAVGYFFIKNRKQTNENTLAKIDTEDIKENVVKYDEKAKKLAEDLIKKLPTDSDIDSRYQIVENNQKGVLNLDSGLSTSKPANLSVSPANLSVSREIGFFNSVLKNQEKAKLQVLKNSFAEFFVDFKNLSKKFPEPNYDTASSVIKKYFLTQVGVKGEEAILNNDEKIFALENNIVLDSNFQKVYFPTVKTPKMPWGTAVATIGRPDLSSIK